MNIQPFLSSFPVIDLGDIILREIAESDAKSYLEYMSKEEMAGSLTSEVRPSNIESALEEVKYWRALFTMKRSIYWAIALKDSDKMIGTAGFNHISFQNSRGELSYDLSPEFWGRGIMLRSIKAILKYSDYNLQLVRVQATVIIDNERSIKVLERCNFEKEGYLKKYEIVEGEYKDYYMYARVI